MAHIFISYSKKDIDFARYLRNLLQDEGFAVWMDETRLVPSEKWWPTIESNITSCSVFIIIMSPNSSKSEWVEREILVAEDENNKKPIFPVLLAGKRLTRLGNIQYEDMTSGLKATLTPRFINGLKMCVPTHTGEPVPPQLPVDPISESSHRSISGFVTKPFNSAVVAWLLILGTLLGIVMFLVNGGVLPTPSPTRVALLSTNTATNTPTSSSTSTLTSTPTITPTRTSTVRPTPSLTSTRSPSQTPTLTVSPRWTPTPSVPDLVDTTEFGETATSRARIIAATATFISGQTVTATFWTLRPTSTYTRTSTYTPTPNLTATFYGIRTQRAAWTATAATAVPTVNGNEQWSPVIKNFDIVEMVLVPPGCFLMGDAGPKICFDRAFWIDRYEVTNAQFAFFAGAAKDQSSWIGGNRPRENINWYEARSFCIQRGARLPTEAEWEYAARGPSNLIYPWSNTFVADNAVYSRNSGKQTADVGSRPGGVSWVGAYDMSGNVYEWVEFYRPLSGTAEPSSTESDSRSQRGGAWDTSSETSLRPSKRSVISGSATSSTIGFRCAR